MMNFLVYDSYCNDLKPVINILKAVIGLIQWGVPFLLILFGMLDLGKAVMSSKEDEMKKAQSTLIRRFIYAVAVFLVVTLVTVVMNLVANSGNKEGTEENANDWKSCWTSTK
jgi:uncharacterized membrane protein